MALKQFVFNCPMCNVETQMGVLDDQGTDRAQTFCRACPCGWVFTPNAVANDPKFTVTDLPAPASS